MEYDVLEAYNEAFRTGIARERATVYEYFELAGLAKHLCFNEFSDTDFISRYNYIVERCNLIGLDIRHLPDVIIMDKSYTFDKTKSLNRFINKCTSKRLLLMR